MLIHSKYLVVPFNPQMKEKTVMLYDTDGKLVFDFIALLDFINPKYTMYMDVRRFIGMDITIKTDPEMNVHFEQTNEKPMNDIYNCFLRPTVHFSAAYGWLNDPNGLVYHNGTYHLFFQHNPVAPHWSNMHWGHATSEDLIHWVEQDIALAPNELGNVASGSAFVDKKNASGLSPDGNTIMLFHTRQGEFFSRTGAGKKSTQCLAYSTDNGKTFQLYDKNPILPTITTFNRDPKVIWCEELGVYLMVLYIEEECNVFTSDFWFFESDNLLDWKLMQKMIHPGDSECPNLFLANVENEPGKKVWVFAGAKDNYIIGHFDAATRQFVIDSESKKLHWGSNGSSYAAQTFSGLPDRAIRVAWNVSYASDTPFNSQIGIPADMTVVNINGEYYLKCNPVKEFDSLVVKADTYRGAIRELLSKNSAYDITLRVPKDAPDFSVTVFGETCRFKPKENVLVYADTNVPLTLKGKEIIVRMILDTLTWEFYMDNGLVYAVFRKIFDKNLNVIEIDSNHAEITVKELDSIWK